MCRGVGCWIKSVVSSSQNTRVHSMDYAHACAHVHVRGHITRFLNTNRKGYMQSPSGEQPAPCTPRGSQALLRALPGQPVLATSALWGGFITDGAISRGKYTNRRFQPSALSGPLGFHSAASPIPHPTPDSPQSPALADPLHGSFGGWGGGAAQCTGLARKSRRPCPRRIAQPWLLTSPVIKAR